MILPLVEKRMVACSGQPTHQNEAEQYANLAAYLSLHCDLTWALEYMCETAASEALAICFLSSGLPGQKMPQVDAMRPLNALGSFSPGPTAP